MSNVELTEGIEETQKKIDGIFKDLDVALKVFSAQVAEALAIPEPSARIERPNKYLTNIRGILDTIELRTGGGIVATATDNNPEIKITLLSVASIYPVNATTFLDPTINDDIEAVVHALIRLIQSIFDTDKVFETLCLLGNSED